jgi:hypothetical protein
MGGVHIMHVSDEKYKQNLSHNPEGKRPYNTSLNEICLLL